MVIHPSALLVFQELPPDGQLSRRRQNRQVRFFDGWQWLSIALVGALITAIVTAAYEHGLGLGKDVDYARAMALATLTLASAGITAALSGLRGVIAKIIVLSTVGLSLLLVQVPWLATTLHLKPLELGDWLIAASAAVVAALIPLLRRTRSSRNLRVG
jgi:Ca2+-transporting ATPase